MQIPWPGGLCGASHWNREHIGAGRFGVLGDFLLWSFEGAHVTSGGRVQWAVWLVDLKINTETLRQTQELGPHRADLQRLRSRWL